MMAPGQRVWFCLCASLSCTRQSLSRSFAFLPLLLGCPRLFILGYICCTNFFLLSFSLFLVTSSHVNTYPRHACACSSTHTSAYIHVGGHSWHVYTQTHTTHTSHIQFCIPNNTHVPCACMYLRKPLCTHVHIITVHYVHLVCVCMCASVCNCMCINAYMCVYMCM